MVGVVFLHLMTASRHRWRVVRHDGGRLAVSRSKSEVEFRCAKGRFVKGFEV